MPLDSSIPLQSVAPDPMASLSSLLDVGTKSLSLQKHRATFDADVARSKADSSTAQSAATVNAANIRPLIDQQAAQTSSAVSKSQVDSANVGSAIRSAKAGADTAETGASNAAFDLRTKQRDSARQFMTTVLTDKNLNNLGPDYDPKKAVQTLRKLREDALANGSDPHTVETTIAKYMGAADNPGGIVKAIHGDVISMAAASQVPSMVNPNIQQVGAGDRTVMKDTNQFSSTATKDPTASIGMNLPVTSQHVNADGSMQFKGGAADNNPAGGGAAGNPYEGHGGNDEVGRTAGDVRALQNELLKRNLDAGQRDILGQELQRAQEANRKAVREAGSQAGNQQPANNLRTSLPPGQEANLKDNVEAMNTHFAKISGVASDAPLGLSLVSNIKSLANSAITGTLQGRTSYVNGLLNSVHLGDKITGDLQKDTDLLEKYLSQLNLSTPAATNAAREIVTAARPHGTMIKGALNEAADQIGSVINANLAVRNHLAGYKFANGGNGDAVNYDVEKRHIEGIADPRIFQLQGKSRDEIKTYMKTLPLADQQELVRKSGLLHQMGITK